MAIKLNAPPPSPHTESTPFAPFDTCLRVHGMQQGARTRATPSPYDVAFAECQQQTGEISWDIRKYLAQRRP